MDMESLTIFCAVASELSVTQAAAQNNLSLIDTLTDQDWVVLVFKKA